MRQGHVSDGLQPGAAGGKRRAPRLLRVGALAVAARRANAVGTVRLTCAPDGLAVDLLHVGRFAVGFAMLAAGRPVSFRVPYTAIRGLVRVGSLLHLSIDPRVAAPYSRFALCCFSVDEEASLVQRFRTRAVARLASLVLPVPAAALCAWLVPRSWIGGPMGLAALAVVVAWLSWQGLDRLVRWLTRGGAESDRLQEVFESTIAYHLGLASPEDVAEAEQPPPVHQPDVDQVDPVGIRGAWSATARPLAFVVVAALGLVATLGAVLAVRQYGVADVVLLPVDEANTGAAGPLRQLFGQVLVRGSPRRAACSCQRTASPLWQEGIDLLSIVLAPSRGQFQRVWVHPGETLTISHPGRAPDSQRAPEVELELGVINNGAAELDTVSLVLTFAQRSPQGRRIHIMERGLHWPARLGPGESVRWSIEAEGTEMRVDCRLQDKLGTVPPAEADSFSELLDARLMPVRLHGAMMLAYLGDSRARSAAESLGPLTAVEEQARTQLLRALTPLRACDPKLEQKTLSLCVFNGTERLHRRLRLSGMSSDGEAVERWVVKDLFHPGRGLKVEVPWSRAEAPSALSVEGVGGDGRE